VSFHLIGTNEPRTAFQLWYNLDGQGWTASEIFTTDRSGTGGGAVTVDDVTAGAHQVALDINTVGPGRTYYLNMSRNYGGGGMYFSCPTAP
jgi:hypothetical protein